MAQAIYKLNEIPDFKNVLEQNTSETCKYFSVSTNTNNYKVIKYNKEILLNDLIPVYGLLRSVILNKENKVVSFAPPKSIKSDTFIKNYLFKSENIVAEEFIEGTMINIFWDSCIGIHGSWEIATRNKVGANTCFYKKSPTKTFQQMFLDCCISNNLTINELNKNYCYSFVMQHPENRIVVPFSKPQLYLVEVYEIIHSNGGDVNVYVQNIENIKNSNVFINTSVKYPNIYKNCNDYSELIDTYASMNTNYEVLGVVIKNKSTGERCKIRNPVYEQVRQLRGNQPKLQFQYLYLRNSGKVKDFLKYYPENKKEFSEYRDNVHLFTNILFKNYISCYIKKEKPLLEFPIQYRSHMFLIHQIYMNDLREQKLFITNNVVIEYVNKMHPAKLMYSLNYTMHKRSVDFIKSNVEMEIEKEMEK